jgi:crotonobetainyl-CoA:carnitine CoA-transferase CaiB-like acyl-CoA transferase
MKELVKPGALSGLKVLDLSRVLAGPWASQLLADLGADVVKVERPKTGDDTRMWGPPWLKDGNGDSTKESAYYSSANRNKRSLAVDLSSIEGQSLVKQLAEKADVFIENFKVGGLKAYGLDYESLKVINPRLIYCSITGFGQTGPYATRPGYDFLIQGLGGMMSVTGRADGTAGEGPVKVGVALTDVMTGLYATIAIQAAIAHRENSGEGQYIDVALLDVQTACLVNQAANYLNGGGVPQRMGNAHPNIVPYQDFPTADGYMIITAGNNNQFNNMCQVLGREEWSQLPRFATNPERVKHRDELVALIGEVTLTRTTDDWVNAMSKAGVPCGPINTIDRVFGDPQVQHRGMQIEMEHGSGALIPLVANPINLSASPVSYRRPPPELGQHSKEVLEQWLGMSSAQVSALHDQHII